MNKKLKISIVAMAMVFVLLVGNILAYFTDADTATNEFTTGRISIDLQEPNWDPSLGGELVPGFELAKDPQVLNDGINDAFIFVTVDVPYQNVTTTDESGNKLTPSDTELFSYDVKDGWIQVGEPVVDTENGIVRYVYAYAQDNEMTTLAPNDTTPTVFDYIRFEGVVEDEGLEDTKLDVIVKAYGIQTDNIDGGKTSPEDVWPIVDTSNGPVSLEDIVIDFGLPVEVPISQLGEDPIVEKLSYATYGTVAIDGDSSKGDFTVTYTPTEILQGIDAVHLVTESGKEYMFNVYPATSVYYEASFMVNDEITENWELNNNNDNTLTQSYEILSKGINSHKKNIYGYDEAYENNENSTCLKLTGSSENVKFNFTGTGYQLYARSNADTGIVFAYVAGPESRQYIVDTKLTNLNNEEVLDVQHNNLPIISKTDLPYGDYTFYIRLKNDESVIIDGIRIINTLNNSDVFSVDSENNPQFYELRDYVLNAIGVENLEESDYISKNDYDGKYNSVKEIVGQVYNAIGEDGCKAIIINEEKTTYTEEDAQKLLDNGPKNELYLYPGQTLLFNVSTNQNIQLGMKSPINSAKFKILVDNKELDLNAVESSVDMFYEIEKSNNNEHTISITVTDGMLSVTNLKACNDLNFALNDLTEKDIEQALASIGYVY